MLYDIYNIKNNLNYLNLKSLYEQFNGPLWVYDSDIIINKIKQLKQFDTIRFAQKSCSNIHILRLIKNYGVKIDSVSLGEIERALLAGFNASIDSDEIVFTSDLLEKSVLSRILDLKIPVNIGSIDMLIQLGQCSPGHRVWLRINPGFGHGHNKKTNTGGINSKHGIWYDDLPTAIDYIQRYKLYLVGLHIHIGSGVDYYHLSRVCLAMMKQVLSCKLDFMQISAGGGLPIPYMKQDKAIDITHYFNLWNRTRQKISYYLGHPIKLEIEPGRFIVAESGMLVSQVRTVKQIGNRYFVLVDVGCNDLLRPAMYGSYHHISLLPADNRDIFSLPFYDTVVGGPICESGDIFTQDNKGEIIPRKLPRAKVGDYLIFHDTGAYGAVMSSNYNSRPFLPEIIYEQGKIRQIRKRQNIQDLLKLEEFDIF